MTKKIKTEKQPANPELTVEYLVTKEFTSAQDFSIAIDTQAAARKIGCMERLLEYCEERNIEPVAMANLISSSLKEKIRAEAEELNLLKKTGKLPA